MKPEVPPYRIIRRIAEGGAGTVYEAEHPGLQRQVAIKVLHRHVSAYPEAIARFANEARVLAKLEHPHVVRVYDVDTAAPTPFIAMELVKGESLDQRLTRTGRLPFDEVHDVAKQVLAVLDAVHAQGIIHRDLKPANLMADATQPGLFVKVVDFGGAQLTPRADELRLTGEGQQLGTALYMSPEQVSGERLDARSDLYSLACVLFELLAGRPPFASRQAVHVLQAHLFREPPTFAELGLDDVPRGFESVLRRALSKPRDARFSSAAEMLAALQSANSGGDHRDAPTAFAHEFIAAEADAPAVKLLLHDAPTELGLALREALVTVGAREAKEDEPGGVALVAGATAERALLACQAALSAAPGRLVLLCAEDEELSFISRAIPAGAFDFIALPLDPVDAGRRTVRALRHASELRRQGSSVSQTSFA